MKKILHFIDSGGLYGAENVLLNLSRVMLLSNDDFLPVVGCIVQSVNEQSDLYDQAVAFGIDAEKLQINNKKFLIDLPKVAFYLKKLGISCIHSHGYKPSVAGFIIKLLTGIPVIATCHLWYMAGKRGLKQRIMIALELFFYRFFQHIVAVSEPIKSYLVQSGVLGEKVKIIKNGIFLDDYSFDSAITKLEFRKKNGIAEESSVFVNIARLTEQKAQDIIINAARTLKQEDINCVFILIGDGALRGKYESMVRENLVEDYVKIIGFTHNVKEWLWMADVYLLPSRDEGLPMGLLEAMASSKPAIVTPVGDIPSLVKHKISAFFIPVDDITALVDSVKWMIANSKERSEIGSKAFSEVKKGYSAEAMFQAYVEIYEKACSKE